MKYSAFEGLEYSDPIPFGKLADPIFLRVRLAMTGSGRQKALGKIPAQHDKNQYLRLNWEGYHLLEFANAVRPPKNDGDGTVRLDGFLAGNSIGGFKQLQTLPSSKRTAFTTAKSKRVFESLAAFQDIPTIVCFLNFLEFCRDSNRPLKVFNGDDPLPPVIIDRKKIPLTLDYAIEGIKKHIEEQIELEEERLKKEKFEKESSLKEREQPKAVQPLLTIPQAKENNSNYYANAVLQVIGREKEKARLGAFLDCDLNVAWFQLAGVAGQGKSRLAFDLIQEAEKKPGWRAGFLTEYGIESFKDHWKDWQPDAHYLLVFDYVIGREQAIKPILQTLIYNQDKFKHTKIRILMIERQRWDQGSAIKANDQHAQDEMGLSVHIGDIAQWFLNLCEQKDFDGEFLKRYRFDDGVEELNDLDQDDLVTIVRQLTMELSGKILTFSDEMLKKTLARIDDSGRPLYAYLLAQQLSESEEGYQSWTKIDLLNYQLIRDKIRWEQAFKGKVPTWGDAHPAMKLAVLATIVREIKFQDAPITKHFGSIDSSLRREAVAIARGYLINNNIRPAEIHALEPDLLGEWFVLYCFHQGFEFEELLNIAWQYSPDKVADFLQRITQDFIDLPKKNRNGKLVEKLLAHAPPHETHYQALGNVAVLIANRLYQRNLPIPQNIIVALEHAINSFNIAAMIYLGFLYRHGIGVITNLERAVDLYQQAVEHGNSVAMFSLGVCYQKGEGVKQDWIKAVELYQRAVEQGNDSAMFSLGLCYQKGEGVEQNWIKAVELYQRAVEQGNGAAMVNLGVCYQNGKGVEQNWRKAIDLYERAVEQGNDAAMFNLGVCYENGEGVEQNWGKAVDLYQRAVAQGNAAATFNLGVFYEKGNGVKQDWNKAVDFYQRAVEQGDSAAMVNLGVCYQNGEGVEQNWNKAVDLYQRAVKAGEDRAIDNIQNVLLQNFLGVGNYKSHKINGWPNRKLPYLKEVPVFDPPIVTGNWKQLTSEEVTVCLNKFIASFEVLELTQRLNGYYGQYGRLLPLKFYKNFNLLDIQLYNPLNKKILIFSAIFINESGILLNRESGMLYSLNRYLLTLKNQKSIIDYLQFFCSYISKDGRFFQIISNSNEIPFNKEVGQGIPEINSSSFVSQYIEGSFEREGWQKLKACVLYENALYDATFKVFPDGKVSMEDGKYILENLPVLQRQYDGIFRSPLKIL